MRKAVGQAIVAEIAEDAAPEIAGNIFDGYTSVVAAPARNRQLLEQNYPANLRRAP